MCSIRQASVLSLKFAHDSIVIPGNHRESGGRPEIQAPPLRLPLSKGGDLVGVMPVPYRSTGHALAMRLPNSTVHPIDSCHCLEISHNEK